MMTYVYLYYKVKLLWTRKLKQKSSCIHKNLRPKRATKLRIWFLKWFFKVLRKLLCTYFVCHHVTVFLQGTSKNSFCQTSWKGCVWYSARVARSNIKQWWLSWCCFNFDLFCCIPSRYGYFFFNLEQTPFPNKAEKTVV